VAASLKKNGPGILAANAADVAAARKRGTPEPLVDRLALNEKRLADALESLETVRRLPDPLGEVIGGWTTEKGLRIRQVRFPFGVVAIIYESRPAVTLDAFALAYKSGNALVLRGSSASHQSNAAIFAAIVEGLCSAGADGVPGAAALLPPAPPGDHSDVDAILNARGLIDVVLPRGGASLIRTVVDNAKIPVIETGSGICHLYVDAGADMDMAVNIAENGKLQRPGVCNALECFVVHHDAAPVFLPKLAERFNGRCEIRCDEASLAIHREAGTSRAVAASPADYDTEFLDTIVAIKCVASVDEAIRFINDHSTKHSAVIVTKNQENAEAFRNAVDAACVYVNASTRFTDGGEFGFGVELGISTQKLHVRGPMGIKALTTTKYMIDGEGQVR
jgi:glutamate-5-semialdehyde dehydrogenase